MLQPKPINNPKLSPFQEADLASFQIDCDPWIYRKLGAQKIGQAGNKLGWSFAVWAPAAQSVDLVIYPLYDPPLEFPLKKVGVSGVWQFSVGNLPVGTRYKFRLVASNGSSSLKADPYAQFSEGPPNNASILYDTGEFLWTDADWLNQRDQDWREKPISVYEVHLGSWRRKGVNYRQLADELCRYLVDMGFSHVEFLPLNEHPLVESWGYQCTGYYGPCHRYGYPHDLMYLVNHLHRHGIGVILDWVPAHFPKDEFSIGYFDGTHLYECAEEWKREHRDWGTWVFDYEKPQVQSFLMGSALAWLDRYHIDGLRVDAVASMLYLDYSRGNDWKPNKFGGNENLEAINFIQKTNAAVRQHFPGVLMIAEESTAYPNVTEAQSGDSLGFHFKWNLGWMHDVLEFFECPVSQRPKRFSQLLHCREYHYFENFLQVFSHDEVVHEKRSLLLKMGAGDDLGVKAADLRTLLVLFWGWAGKKTLFMGGEFGQVGEWAVNDVLQWHLLEDPLHEGIQCLVRELNQLYVHELTTAQTDSQPEAFQWVDTSDSQGLTLSFLRWGRSEGETLLYAFNFGSADCVREIAVPECGEWSLEVDTESVCFGGRALSNSLVYNAERKDDLHIQYTLNTQLSAHSAQIWRRKP